MELVYMQYKLSISNNSTSIIEAISRFENNKSMYTNPSGPEVVVGLDFGNAIFWVCVCAHHGPRKDLRLLRIF